MGNICSGCQREKEAPFSYNNTPSTNQKLQISYFIEKQRSKYTDHSQSSSSFRQQLLESCAEPVANQKVLRSDKIISAKEFYKRSSNNASAFNASARPSAVYRVDEQFIKRGEFKALSIKSDSTADPEALKMHRAATSIQRWFKMKERIRLNHSLSVASSANQTFCLSDPNHSQYYS